MAESKELTPPQLEGLSKLRTGHLYTPKQFNERIRPQQRGSMMDAELIELVTLNGAAWWRLTKRGEEIKAQWRQIKQRAGHEDADHAHA